MNELLEVKATLAVSDEGEITGTAWVWSEPDRVNDVIVKGAIHIPTNDIPMLYRHQVGDLIGSWNEILQADTGLVVKGQLHMQSARARSVLSMLKSKLVDGLSLGFRTLEAKQVGKFRHLTAIDLAEISIVPNPAHPRARVTSAKSFDSASFQAVAERINAHTAAQLIRNHR